MTENSEPSMNEDPREQEIDSAMPIQESTEDQMPIHNSTNEADLGVNPDATQPSPITDVSVSDSSLSPETEDGALTQLATEVESLRLQIEERSAQYMRIAADFDNFRKRTDREKGELELRVKRDVINTLLPVIDSFEMARTQIKPQTEQEVNIHKSYQGVYKQLVDGLKRVGVSPMRVEGQPFDPNFHDAIMREPTDEHPEGTVIEDLRRGYLLGDLVLRHAMVKVATQPEGTAVTVESEALTEDSV